MSEKIGSSESGSKGKNEVKEAIITRVKELASHTLGTFSLSDQQLSNYVASRIQSLVDKPTNGQELRVLNAIIAKVNATQAIRYALIFRACLEVGKELGKIAIVKIAEQLFDKLNVKFP